MAIEVTCPNGHSLKVAEKFAGKKAKCPKCSATIEIPETVEEFVDLDSMQDSGGLQSFGFPELGGLPAVDPLQGVPTSGDGNTAAFWNDASMQSAPMQSMPNQATPSYVAPSQKPVTNASAASSDSSTLVPSILVGVAAGALFFLLSAGGYLLLRSFGGKEEVGIKNPPPIASPPAITQSTPPVKEPVQATAPPSSASIPPSEKPVDKPPVATPKIEYGLAKFNTRKNMEGFLLPNANWGAAYDEESGRLAITDDSKGLVIYDIHEVLSGKYEPLKIIETFQPINAVCFKKYQDKKYFIYCEKETDKALFINAETFEKGPTLQLDTIHQVIDLETSNAPNDPMLYFSFDKHPDDRSGKGNLSRIDIDSKSVDRVLLRDVNEFRLIPETEYLALRTSHETVLGKWSDLLQFHADPRSGRGDKFNPLSVFQSYGRIAPLGNYLWIGGTGYTPAIVSSRRSYGAVLSSGFQPMARFRTVPWLFGSNESGYCFGSEVDGAIMKSIPFPKDWIGELEKRPQDISKLEKDYRNRSMAKSYFSVFRRDFADDKRKLAISVLSHHLVIIPLAPLELPEEKTLRPSQRLPEVVEPGKLVDTDLLGDQKDVDLELVMNSDFLPSNSISVFGNTPSEASCTLQTPLSPGETEFQLRGDESIDVSKFPLFARIGNEVVKVTGKKKGKFVSERSRDLYHSQTSQVEFLNEKGEPLNSTRPASGLVCSLRASVDPNQTLIIVNPGIELDHRPLPFTIQIGEEKMLVTSFGEEVSRWNVVRSIEANHDVTEPIYIMEKETASLPKLENGHLTWVPTASQMGFLNIRVQAMRGGVRTDWIFPVEVASPVQMLELPMDVDGIAPEANGSLVAVWSSVKIGDGKNPNVGIELNDRSVLGIYDTSKKQMIHQAECDGRILGAIIHTTGLYALCGLKGKDGKPANKICRYDLESLKLIDSVPTKATTTSGLDILADKFLVNKLPPLDPNRPREVFTQAAIEIPGMKPSSLQERTAYYALYGRVKNGWVIDGVLWSEDLKDRKLLLYPHRLMVTQDGFVVKQDVVSSVADGDSVVRMGFSAGYAMRDFPILINDANSNELKLELHGMYGKSELKVQLADRASMGGDREKWIPRRGGSDGYSIWENKNSLFLHQNEGLWIIPKELVSSAAPPTFEFEPHQSKFMIEAGKETNVIYSAPGAKTFELRVWLNRKPVPWLDFGDEDQQNASCILQSTSEDGSFELTIDSEAVAKAALGQMPSMDGGLQDLQKKITAYVKERSDYVKQLTGQPLRSLPAVATAVVTATHENGTSKAYLVHNYIVEVPLNDLKKILKDGTLNKKGK